VTRQSGNLGVTLNIWQRLIKERYKGSFINATSAEVARQPAVYDCTLVNMKCFDFNKEAVSYNTDSEYLPCCLYPPPLQTQTVYSLSIRYAGPQLRNKTK
jgi:hypothetical protein